MKIGVIGDGKMGKRIQEVVQTYGDEAVTLTSSLIETEAFVFTEEPEIMIDFSHPDNLEKLLTYSLQKKLPLVIGTTGYSSEQFQKIQQAGQDIPVLYSSNFSLGVLVMNQLVQQATAALKNWQIELIEKHHSQKKDAPSGTAKTLIESIQEVRKLTPVYSREKQPRNDDEIGVHSIRVGSLPGEHEVLFATTDEVLSIKHEAFSNRIFADGAVNTAIWLKDQPAGWYQLKDMLA